MVTFIASILLVVYAANIRNPYMLLFVVLGFLIAFALIVKKHNAVKFSLKTTQFIVRVNEEEIQRKTGNMTGIFDGKEFEDSQHSYARDLDVLGSNSLFQFVVRSRLDKSRKLAAQWLLNPTAKKEILDRQEAIEELKNELDWRQQFTALGMHAESNKEETSDQVDQFVEWIAGESTFQIPSYLKVVAVLMPCISLIALALIAAFGFPYQIIFFPVLVNLIFLKITFMPLLDFTKKFNEVAKILKSYEVLIAAVENRTFTSKKLQVLKSDLFSDNIRASKAIRSLRAILMQLLNRANMFYSIVNVLFLLDAIWLLQANSWKKKYGRNVQKWFSSLQEIDVLNDMASMAFANPDFINPKQSDNNFQLTAISLGHPLIHSDRITNDFEINGSGSIGLVTGSNMSGKSTFLRTVGINLVMAQVGLPVCASSFEYSATRVFTSMRTEDNLAEHISSFYAELFRIKRLLDSINDEPVFFLLDEILKGTNSEDRHSGSIALVDQLSHKNATGLISTHDLKLSKYENKSIKNYSFNSTIEGDEILFDYKLTNGPCRSFNASKLMEKMGIIVKKG